MLVSWQFFGPYGVTKYGSGWRKDVVNQSLELALSPFLTGRMFVREPSWKYLANLAGSYLGELFFANLVGSIRRTATKLYPGSK